MEDKNENGVAHDVLPVHPGRDIHGGLGVAHGPQQSGAAVIQGDEGVGQGGDDEVGHRALHDRRFHLAEEQPQQGAAQDQGQGHNNEGGGGDDVHQLVGGTVGPLQIFRADGLGAHHRAAGGQGGKDVDDEHVDQIHQGYAGYGGLTGGGDHHDVGHAYHDGQELLDDQGNDEFFQGLLVKHGGHSLFLCRF